MSAKFPRGGGAGPFLARSLHRIHCIRYYFDIILDSGTKRPLKFGLNRFYLNLLILQVSIIQI